MIRTVIFGMAFCLTLVFGAGWNYAVAVLGANEVSMGTFVVPKGVQGTDACYPRYSYTGWGTEYFNLAVEWCCGGECNSMTNSYPVNNALSDYTSVWMAQNCAHVFTSAEITNGYTVTETNPCTGQIINSHDVVGEQGAACQATETRVRCGDSGTSNCADTTRSGFKISRTACDGTQLADEYLYDGLPGDACNSQITTERCGPTLSVKCFEGANQSSKSGLRITRTNCDNSNPSYSYTFDGDNGTSFNYKGKVNSCADLPTNPTPAQNDAYLVGGDGEGRVCIYSGGWPASCPDGCAEFVGPQGEPGTGVCTGVADASTAVKNTVRSYVAHVGNTRGYMQLQHSMCDDESTVNDQMPDKCVPVMPANAATCADGTYLECTPQNGGSVYNICESTTGTPINSAIGDVDPCATATTSELKSKTVKTAVTEYHSASGEQTSGARAVGYTTTTQKMCSGTAADDLVITQQDLCERSVTNKGNTTCNAGYEWKTCTHGGTPYYGCFPEENIGKDEVSSDYTDPVFSGSVAPGYLTMTVGGKNVKAYDKCTAVGKVGTSVNASISGQKCQCGGIKSDGFCTSLGKQYCLGISNDGSCSNALEIGEVLDQNNPCAGANANSTTIVKKITTGAYDRGTVSDGVYPKVGVTQVTKEMCSGTNTEYVEDTCVEIAKPSGVCTPKTSGYLYCLNQTDNTTYYVCKDLGAENNSIAGKLDEKADASDVTQSALATTLGNTYLKPTDSINAANLSGKVNVERLPDNVVTTTNNKISTDILPNTVVTTTNDKISASILPDSVVTTSSLGSTVSNAIASEVEKGSTGAFKDFATQTSLSGYVKTDGTNLPASVVTTSGLDNAIAGKTVTFGSKSMTLGDVIELLSSAVGTCTESTVDGRTTTSCTGGSLDLSKTSARA